MRRSDPGAEVAETRAEAAGLLAALRSRGPVGTLLRERRPFLAICLSHQVLSALPGLVIVRRPVPNQGVRREIDLFGRRECVGFCNTFAARADDDTIDGPGVGAVQISRDAETGEVHALRGQGFASLQFRPESVLTENGPASSGDS